MVLIFEVVAQRLHIKRGSLIAMYKHDKLFPDTSFSGKNHLIVKTSGLKVSLMFFKGIDKKIALSVLDDSFAAFFQKKVGLFVVLEECLSIQSFDFVLIDLIILVDEAKLQFFPELIIDLVQKIDIVLERREEVANRH